MAAWVAIRKSSRIKIQIISKTYRPPGRTNATALLFYNNEITITKRYTWTHDIDRVLYEGLSDKEIDLGFG